MFAGRGRAGASCGRRLLSLCSSWSLPHTTRAFSGPVPSTGRLSLGDRRACTCGCVHPGCLQLFLSRRSTQSSSRCSKAGCSRRALSVCVEPSPLGTCVGPLRPASAGAGGCLRDPWVTGRSPRVPTGRVCPPCGGPQPAAEAQVPGAFPSLRPRPCPRPFQMPGPGLIPGEQVSAPFPSPPLRVFILYFFA